MLTVVTLTMWKFPPFLDFLCDVMNHPLVGEVILIDNNRAERPATHRAYSNPKLKVLDFGRNILVNPAWNIGVMGAAYDKVVVTNDDIIYDTKVFDRVYDYITPENGTIGFGTVPPTEIGGIHGMIEIVPWVPGVNTYAFGSFFCVHKQTYDPIPTQLRVYFGDNWIFDTNVWKGKQNYVIRDIFYFNEIGATGRHLPWLIDIFKTDKKFYKQIIQSRGLDPRFWCPEHYAEEENE